MSDFDQFKTRDRFNEGTRVPLCTPDGKETDHWLMVRNFRCDAYREALNAIQARIADKGAPEPAQAEKDRLSLLASLVADWSFEGKCDTKGKEAFLADAQLIAEEVDRIAMDDARFFGDGSTPSSDGPKPK